jgi:hypothetical protein
MAYDEATAKGTDPRELKTLTLHGSMDEQGEPNGVIIEKTFASEHHAPVEKQFAFDEGHALLDYIGHCLGMDHKGQIAAFEVGADDEEEQTGDESEQPESEGY